MNNINLDLNVFTYKDRTIGWKVFGKEEELKNNWQDLQSKFCADYQFGKEQVNIWDFYLALVCPFSINDSHLRLKIESDRLFCRKIIIESKDNNTFSDEEIRKTVFPEIKLDHSQKFSDPLKLVDKLNSDLALKIEQRFFTEDLEQSDDIDTIYAHILSEIPKDVR